MPAFFVRFWAARADPSELGETELPAPSTAGSLPRAALPPSSVEPTPSAAQRAMLTIGNSPAP